MSFNLRPYRTVEGPDFDALQGDLDLLAAVARKVRPITDSEYESRPGFVPYNPDDFFFDHFDLRYLPLCETEATAAGRRVSGAIAMALGWDLRLSPMDFNRISWTLFCTDLRRLSGMGLNVGQWHGDRISSRPRGFWASRPGTAGFCLLVPPDQEGLAYCTQSDDIGAIKAFAMDPKKKIITIRGNTAIETTEDMIHCREDLETAEGLDVLHYAMRIHWPI